MPAERSYVPQKESPRSQRVRTGSQRGPGLLARGLEQLDRIAVGILQLDLFPARADFHLIAKLQSSFSQLGNAGGQVPHLQDNPIPSARLLWTTVGHEPRPRRAGTTEDELEMA